MCQGTDTQERPDGGTGTAEKQATSRPGAAAPERDGLHAVDRMRTIDDKVRLCDEMVHGARDLHTRMQAMRLPLLTARWQNELRRSDEGPN